MHTFYMKMLLHFEEGESGRLSTLRANFNC